PMRSPWPILIVTSRRAGTSMYGLREGRNIWPTRNSLRVSCRCLRTRNVRPTPFSSIRAMNTRPPGPARGPSQVEDQLALLALERESRRRRQQRRDDRGGEEGGRLGHPAVDHRLAQERQKRND